MKSLTREQLVETLSYDEHTGVFSWTKNGGRRKLGKPAGSLSKSDGYVYVHAAGIRLAAHRLAWLYVTGEMPSQEIDHINGLRSDNRFANLRSCSRRENAFNKCRQSNNRSGAAGVCFVTERGGKWKSYIYVRGRQRWLGRFETFDAAVTARAEAVKKHYGAFASER